MMDLEDYNDVPLTELWVEWQVESHTEYKDSLSCYGFRVVSQEQRSINVNNVLVPLLWLTGLEEKFDWLAVLRSPRHIPRDPRELVRFMKQVKEISNLL